MSDTVPVYRCPGEAYPISQSVHWGRLAAFYPACRNCPHRDDTGPLSTRFVEQLTETRGRAITNDLFCEEGLSGVEYNELIPQVAQRAAGAFAGVLQQQVLQPTIAVASDRRPTTIELLAAAAEGLRLAGCHIVDVGSTSAPCLVSAIDQLQADGALLVGNEASVPHTASLKFWGPTGAPLSRGAGLEAVEEQFHQLPSRPPSSYGKLRRYQAEPGYLAPFRPRFHALRPLRIILDTSCQPLRGYLRELAAQVACEFLPPSAAGEKPAHARLWIDGDGESFRLTDERQQPIDPSHLLVAFAEKLVRDSDRPHTVVVESNAPGEVFTRLEQLKLRVVVSSSTRAAVHAALTDSQATLAGGPSGRLWFGGGAPDALAVLTELLALLSTSDRPLSEVIARAIFSDLCPS